MHTRQGVAVPALSQDSARPHPITRSEAIHRINRLHAEATDICAAAHVTGSYTREQLRRLTQIHCEATAARQALYAPLQPRIEPETVQLTPDHGMYPLEVNQDGTTRHSRHCKATFSRRDWSCHRCCELMKGAAPRKGWQRVFFSNKLDDIGQRRFLW